MCHRPLHDDMILSLRLEEESKRERRSMIRISNLCKKYGRLEVLRDINLEIPSGEIFGLIGRSGAGKSTLLRCLNGLESYDSGCVTVDGIRIEALSSKELRLLRRNVGMVFQDFSLLSRATVYENIALSMHLWGCSSADISARVKELLEVVGIPEKIHCKPRELSGGQKQRVAIARSLAMNPNVLLCDEATSALDPQSTMAILKLLDDINRRFNITVVMVTHEMEVVKSLCGRMAVLEGGEVKAFGKVLDLFMDYPPALQNLLGDLPSIPSEGVSLELRFEPGDVDSTLLTRMARELNVDFRILSSSSLVLKGSSIESVRINIDRDAVSEIRGYLEDHGVKHKELISEV